MATKITDSITFTYTALGEPVFIRTGSEYADAYKSIRLMEWTAEELRAMADFKDQNWDIGMRTDKPD